MSRFSSRDLFAQLNGREYRGYEDLEKEVLAIFNEHLADFPPRYSYRQAIEWGERNNWIVRAGKKLRVELENNLANVS